MIKQAFTIFCLMTSIAMATSTAEHNINESNIHNVDIKVDEYHINSNLWGATSVESKIDKFDFNITFPQKDQLPSFEYNWDIPAKLPRPIYPYIGYGTRMWSKTLRSSTRKLPMKIGDIAQCELIHAIDIDAVNFRKSKGNLAYDVWFGKKAAANNDDQRIEMMLWLDVHEQWPVGAKNMLGTYLIDGIKWKLYIGILKLPGAINGVTVCTFIAQSPCHQGKLDMLKYMDILKKEKILKDEYYLGGIELGSEVFKGKGATSIKAFAVDLRHRGISSKDLSLEWRFTNLPFGKKIFRGKSGLTIPAKHEKIATQRSIALRFACDNSEKRQVLYKEGDVQSGLLIELHQGKLHFTGWNSKKGWTARTISTPLINRQGLQYTQYHNAILTLDSTKGKLQAWLDGKLVGETAAGTLEAGRALATIAFSALSQAKVYKPCFFSGIIDDVLIYERVLSEQEIKLFK